MAKFSPKPKPGKRPLPKDTLKNIQRAKYARAFQEKKVGQGYAGLGPQELNRRKYQAKMLTKKAGAKADKLEYQANYLETTGYPDIFGDKKYLRKKAEGLRKIEQQFDKQYNKLGK